MAPIMPCALMRVWYCASVEKRFAMPRRMKCQYTNGCRAEGRGKIWQCLGVIWKHTIVLRGLQIEAHKIRQEEIVLCEIPCAITDHHGIGIVGCSARGGHVVQRRHDGGSPTVTPVVGSAITCLSVSTSKRGWEQREYRRSVSPMRLKRRQD